MCILTVTQQQIYVSDRRWKNHKKTQQQIIINLSIHRNSHNNYPEIKTTNEERAHIKSSYLFNAIYIIA